MSQLGGSIVILAMKHPGLLKYDIYIQANLSDIIFEKLLRKPLKTNLVQIKILSNHQNGKDSHVRQIKVYAPTHKSLLQDEDAPPFSSLNFQMYSILR